MTEPTNTVEQAVSEGGAYDIIRQRLTEQGQKIDSLISDINDARQQEFGSTEMKVLGRMRLRTENNCQAKDLVIVGDKVLFGYNVFIGLKKETKIDDVLSLYSLIEHEGQFELRSVPSKDSFLEDSRFQTEFKELYTYYKSASLSQLVVKDGRLLASFSIGEKLTDVRVFRWQISTDGQTLDYIDNRGERDLQLPSSHDFEWVECTRDDVVDGRNPHINILDTLFVDSSRGDITIKVEDNTNVGLGIYSEPVSDETQSIDDGDFYYVDLGQIIILKIKPYQEELTRYLVFNKNNQNITRIDAIGDACLSLPENHGIIFPGGYYLTTGEHKSFDDSLDGLVYKRTLRSPNGEDVLYVFYQPESNVIALYAYNLIERNLQNPQFGHGYGFYEDGRMIIFYADEEPNRVHPIQIWQTPYYSAVFASSQPVSQNFYAKIGNAELVRGISELYGISKSIASQDVSSNHYGQLSRQCQRIFDSYFWLDSAELQDINRLVKEIGTTAESVIDEYEKVESIRKQSDQALTEAEANQQEIIRSIEPSSWHSPQEFVEGLNRIRQYRGHLMTIKDYRYINVTKITELDNLIGEIELDLCQQTVDFLSSDDALDSYYKMLEDIAKNSEKSNTNAELKPFLEKVESLAQGLDLISEMMATLKVEDATVQTRIVDSVSELYGKLNQQRAELEHQRKSMGSVEATGQFSARIKLLNQSIHNALGLSSTPEKCDEQVSRLLIQLEELEGEFSDYDDFVNDIITKREEIFESFEEHKQSLIEQRQRKAQSLASAGERILQSVQRRVKRFNEQDELNTFFASDGLVTKIRDIIGQLHEYGDSVKAEDIDSQLKAAKQQAIRSLRDQNDLYEDGGHVIKLGPRHKFAVNKQDLDLTILPKDKELFIRLTGTDFFERLENNRLTDLSEYWPMVVPSETESLYRSEYLAFSVLKAAESNQDNLSWSRLSLAAADVKELTSLVTDYASPRFRDGYEKGIHDHDAVKILQQLVSIYEMAGVFKYSPLSRGLACIYWANLQGGGQQKLWQQKAKSASQMATVFSDGKAKFLLRNEIEAELTEFVTKFELEVTQQNVSSASEYLVDELANQTVSFSTSKYARQLCEDFITHLTTNNVWQDYQKALSDIKGQIGKRWQLAESWLSAFTQSQSKERYTSFIGEAIGILNAEKRIDRQDRQIDIQVDVEGLIGTHNRISDRQLTIQLDEFLDRNQHHVEVVLPGYHQYHQLRSDVVNEQRTQLRLHEFKAKPLSSFVRNKLINDVYLPLIGDNLAKQIGTVGDKKRTDLMGLLLMISPPGYGKTTLMEYVADRLGLIFMKINCPVIGHDVTSVDPEQADNSAAKQELEKLNLALEMGNNVMLYLDDIQHTNSEFLQKFISLCDGTRRIEGVWKKQPKTYDMRGKKFCVVMAGNPYTESGDAFQIPDMLANRADIYNLGDVLGGKEEVFALSYIENSLTSNPILAPLATREMSDVYKFIDMANGKNVAATDLSHQYSGAEVKEIVAVLQKMQAVQQVVWRVNREYIAASAQDDKYRTEPAFKLQGSYRNMNKMSEKISSIMTEDEITRLIDDHYLGESQLLTTGTEANLLKLAELRDCLSDEERERWEKIKKDFARNKAMGGDDSDAGNKIVVQLNDLVTGFDEWKRISISNNESNQTINQSLANSISNLGTSQHDENNLQSVDSVVQAINHLSETFKSVSKQTGKNQPDTIGKDIADALDKSLTPLIKIMSGKLDLDLGTHQKMTDISDKLEMIEKQSQKSKQTKNKKL
ncbi:MAG: DNA repair ATPase [Kangiellaceae bacterium]|nr:DNA repair ATPase [Kangiellaceae bacterium]